MLGLFRTIIMRSEEIAHSRIKSWNDGTYCAIAFQDHVGTEESLSRCHVTMRKQDDHITFDFRGSSPEHDAGADPYVPDAKKIREIVRR